MRIDIHNHFAPAEYLELLIGQKGYPSVERRNGGYFLQVEPLQAYQLQPGMFQVETRLKDMDAAGIDIHVVSCIVPAGEVTPDPGLNLALAQAANEGIARVVREHPERFVGMATLPLLTPSEAVKELDRAVNELGFRAVMLTSNVGGKSLDDLDLWPVYERLEELDVPAMIHPSWPLMIPQAMRQWRMVQVLGFLFDTTLAMTRIILSGLMERYPNLKFILCHCGSTIPYVIGRINRGAGLGSEGTAEIGDRPPSEYFKRVYLDTVCYHQPSIMLAYATSGLDQLLYGSDYPYGPIAPTVVDVEGLEIPQEEKAAIMSENARRLLKLA